MKVELELTTEEAGRLADAFQLLSEMEHDRDNGRREVEEWWLEMAYKFYNLSNDKSRLWDARTIQLIDDAFVSRAAQLMDEVKAEWKKDGLV